MIYRNCKKLVLIVIVVLLLALSHAGCSESMDHPSNPRNSSDPVISTVPGTISSDPGVSGTDVNDPSEQSPNTRRPDQKVIVNRRKIDRTVQKKASSFTANVVRLDSGTVKQDLMRFFHCETPDQDNPEKYTNANGDGLNLDPVSFLFDTSLTSQYFSNVFTSIRNPQYNVPLFSEVPLNERDGHPALAPVREVLSILGVSDFELTEFRDLSRTSDETPSDLSGYLVVLSQRVHSIPVFNENIDDPATGYLCLHPHFEFYVREGKIVTAIVGHVLAEGSIKSQETKNIIPLQTVEQNLVERYSQLLGDSQYEIIDLYLAQMTQPVLVPSLQAEAQTVFSHRPVYIACVIEYIPMPDAEGGSARMIHILMIDAETGVSIL